MWNVSLKAMAERSSWYQSILALLQEEFLIEPQYVDPNPNCHRVIHTLYPLKLPISSQGVVNISGLTVPQIRLDRTDTAWIYYGLVGVAKNRIKHLPYPPGTIGVYYFKQSTTAPTRIGELRFRLCRDVREFNQGTDWCTPSGQIWCLNSQSIYTRKFYKALHNFLITEGLLEHN